MSQKTPTVELAIGPDGTVKFEVSGISGQGCEELEAALLRALGATAQSRERTPEFYEGQGILHRMKAALGKG